MMNESFPHIPPPLLAELNRRFPERSAEPAWSDREVWLKAGERNVVRFLNEMFQRQNDPRSGVHIGPVHEDSQ